MNTDRRFEPIEPSRVAAADIERGRGWERQRESGAPVTFASSAVRNVLRIVDILPGSYIVGIVSILVSSRNQRLGDHAAGTLVVRDRKALPPEPVLRSYRRPSDAPAWDTSAIGPDELAAVRHFLARRETLTWDARTHLAAELAARLRPKVGGAVASESPEIFLERLAAAKAGRGA